VDRDHVILPEQTLKLLDRNVLRFIESRDALRSLGQSTRKGILLYGPPGGVSAAFIKELMRRIVQSAIVRDGGKSATSADIDEVLIDMLFVGGRCNVKLLGGAQEMAGAA